MYFPPIERSFRFQYSTVTTGEFRDFFVSFFADAFAATAASSVKDAKSQTPKKKNKKNKSKSPSPTPATADESTSYAWTGTVEEQRNRLQAIESLNWENLFLGRGLPSYPAADDFSNPLSKEAIELAEEWLAYLQPYAVAEKSGQPLPLPTLRSIYKHKQVDLEVIIRVFVSIIILLCYLFNFNDTLLIG